MVWGNWRLPVWLWADHLTIVPWFYLPIKLGQWRNTDGWKVPFNCYIKLNFWEAEITIWGQKFCKSRSALAHKVIYGTTQQELRVIIVHLKLVELQKRQYFTELFKMWCTCIYHYLIIFSTAHFTSQCSICAEEFLKKTNQSKCSKIWTRCSLTAQAQCFSDVLPEACAVCFTEKANLGVTGMAC